MEFNKRIYKCLYINYLCVKRQKSEDVDSVMGNYNKDFLCGDVCTNKR